MTTNSIVMATNSTVMATIMATSLAMAREWQGKGDCDDNGHDSGKSKLTGMAMAITTAW